VDGSIHTRSFSWTFHGSQAISGTPKKAFRLSPPKMSWTFISALLTLFHIVNTSPSIALGSVPLRISRISGFQSPFVRTHEMGELHFGTTWPEAKMGTLEDQMEALPEGEREATAVRFVEEFVAVVKQVAESS